MHHAVINSSEPEIGVKVHSVTRPRTWRNEPYTMSYLLVAREIDPAELIGLLRWAVASKMPNPRVVTPHQLRLASLFHPRFFKSVRQECPCPVEPLNWRDDQLPLGFDELSRLWLQSVLFLSGVTLSAAIIQNRFSAETIGSKLDRLWDAGLLAVNGLAPELAVLDLPGRVAAIAADHAADVARLLAIRECFMDALKIIAPVSGTVEIMRKQLTGAYGDGRFDFIHDLQKRLGNVLRGVVVYGSSILSDQFADIDAVVVVDDPVPVLLALAGQSPAWHGKELNLGIYSPAEFLVMQYLSGDNLSDYGLCIWGEVEVVRKPVAELLARNFSFGVVRQRQQFGMLSYEIEAEGKLGPDRRNLCEYFVKIPANIVKGTLGAAGRILPKEQVHEWLLANAGFDTLALQRQSITGHAVEALASASLATGEVLIGLNNMVEIIHY